MVPNASRNSSSRNSCGSRALTRVHGTVPALPSGGQARPAASERCEHGLFCAHACRKKCSGVSGDHGGIACAGRPGQRAMVRPHEALRCRSCRSKISAGTYLCNFTLCNFILCNFMCNFTCLAAYHLAAFQPRSRPRSSFPTRKVAQIGPLEGQGAREAA